MPIDLTRLRALIGEDENSFASCAMPSSAPLWKASGRWNAPSRMQIVLPSPLRLTS